ncbi:phage tail protein [Deinococcus roseus]|uniref:Tail Collar domain-containing protein n=1 Tax=Deinococcus roseus TaxID=392414 RepID=A0ABQ2D3R5_9DEIO|nr:tail fiber protein [Deinococcus roseus]GGJ45044.1 tail Collar domain-containing protein [Deinococcus roseus]
MSEPFLSEIRIMSFNFAPKGWALCNGQFLPINQNQALFSLLGTTYGGNGQTTFALPNFRGRTPIHMGSGYTLGQSAGQESHTITISELPTHNHLVVATKTIGNDSFPTAHLLAGAGNVYRSYDNLTSLVPSTVSTVGGSQAHQNMQPFLVLNFCIALQGIFPSQN